MAAYVTKRVTVYAEQFTGDNYDEINTFIGRDDWFRPAKAGEYNSEGVIAAVFDVIHSTWVGVLKGNYIIRGPIGEVYPCDATPFGWKYEKVND